jgi:transposase InsO family protein
VLPGGGTGGRGQPAVDGSFVEANANKGSRIPREQLAEAAQVNQTVRQYLVELEQQNTTEEPVHQQEQVSTTDPDATYATKGGTPARLGYYDNYLVDNHSCVIVGVQATAARMSQETVAAQDMIARFAEWQGRDPVSVAADATYEDGEFLQWLMERGITPYMRTRDSALRKNSPLYGPDRFTFLPKSNSYHAVPQASNSTTADTVLGIVPCGALSASLSASLSACSPLFVFTARISF